MSKFLKVLIALLAITLFSSVAMAGDLTLKGYYQVRAISYDNLDVDDTADDNATGVDQRMRLWFNGSANENVKGVFAIEVDNVWGDTGAGGKQVGKIGADAKGQIEVKSAYLDVTLPDSGVNLKAGTQGFKQAQGMIIADDAAGLKVAKTFGDTKVDFMWIKVAENSNFDDANDSDYYTVQATMNAGGFKVTPLVGYAVQDKIDFTNLYLGATADGKVGNIGLSLAGVVSSWDATATDGTGFAAKAKAVVPVGDASVYGMIGYMGDSDSATGEFVDVSNYNNFAEVLTGGKFDGRGTVGAQAVGDTKMNWLYVKAGAKVKVDDKSSIDGSVIYAEQAEDVGATAAITYGFEVDAYYTRTLTPGVSLLAGGGYLFADKEFGPDDAYKVGTALTVKF